MTPWNELTDLTSPADVNQEMAKKYKNTYLKIISNTEPHTETLALYEGYVDGYHHFTDFSGTNLKLVPNTKHKVKIWYPKKGLYNSVIYKKNNFIFFQRLPSRQYKKGINIENCIIQEPIHNWITQENHTFYEKLQVKAIFDNNKITETLEDTYKVLKTHPNEFNSIAINNRWGLSLPLQDNSEDFVLWFMDKPVATYKNNTITFKHESFIQELLDEEDNKWYINNDIK